MDRLLFPCLIFATVVIFKRISSTLNTIVAFCEECLVIFDKDYAPRTPRASSLEVQTRVVDKIGSPKRKGPPARVQAMIIDRSPCLLG
jgi:hypothetical protein